MHQVYYSFIFDGWKEIPVEERLLSNEGSFRSDTGYSIGPPFSCIK